MQALAQTRENKASNKYHGHGIRFLRSQGEQEVCFLNYGMDEELACLHEDSNTEYSLLPSKDTKDRVYEQRIEMPEEKRKIISIDAKMVRLDSWLEFSGNSKGCLYFISLFFFYKYISDFNRQDACRVVATLGKQKASLDIWQEYLSSSTSPTFEIQSHQNGSNQYHGSPRHCCRPANKSRNDPGRPRTHCWV